ncbi:hypothetical protein AVEN_233153-1 [Araneus ventricosus]|uniref:Uncharacterized protein n=1 Tax=Araneus ventricosus TaxID=182803 RepID=A0A4Y2VSS8_ARAVE|nr:hypothetical protein AVEN_26180-1 [Araneus ventricosus]GBO27663.1 hypothetical protein AVEN_87058-1 [Araneus ventricosus]GBO27678.1 hypothetical protein AVEN_117073-1 [Araneus ventricosus]GBO27751.1 hypothetical protein AVEN_233153-1 [Araneus ventricosus]
MILLIEENISFQRGLCKNDPFHAGPKVHLLCDSYRCGVTRHRVLEDPRLCRRGSVSRVVRVLESRRVSMLALVELGVAGTLVREGGFPHLNHLHDPVLLRHLQCGRHVGGAGWDALGALAPEGWTLARGAALDSEAELFGHLGT